MKHNSLYYLAAPALSVAWLLSPAPAQAQNRTTKSHNMSVNTNGKAEHCSDLKVTSSNGQVAQTAETFTLTRAEAPTLELSGMDRGVLSVRGWDRAEYSVEACKVAVADDQAGAQQVIRSIAVNRSGGRFTSSGPTTDESNWQVYFIVHAPKSANLSLETRNGPISVDAISGNVKVRAINGPVSLNDCSGVMEVNTTNGPISFNGGGGEVHLTAQNGPISLNLAGEVWNGSKLEAHTHNGPVSLNVPDAFRSGVRLETSGHSPISCRAGGCQNAWTNNGSDQKVMQMNGSQDTIRVTTENGPVSVNGSSKVRKII